MGDGGPAFAVTPHEDEGLVLRYHNFAAASTMRTWSLEITIIIRIKGEGQEKCIMRMKASMRACAGLSGGGR